MDITLPLDQMTVAEKLRLIDVIWADLERHPEEVPSPAWHEQVLNKRMAKIESGEAKFYSLEEVEAYLDDLVDED